MIAVAAQAQVAALIVAACGYRFVAIVLCAVSWRWLLTPAARPALRRTVLLRWIGESINSIVPWAQVGGDLVRARLLRHEGVAAPEARAAMVADLLLGALTQTVFTSLGLLGASAALRAAPLGFAAAALSAVLLAFVVIRFGFAHVERWAARSTRRRGVAIQLAALRALATKPRTLGAAAGWHLLAWLSHAGETWGVLRGLGSPVSVSTALVIESLSYATRSAAFFLPGGLGAQEAALLVLGRGFGLPTATVAVLAFVKRARELAVGGAGMAAWWWLARRRARIAAERLPAE